jgi:orotidine-5'-phosphate decarboxylase
MYFQEKIRLIQREANSLLCIGLDPDEEKIPVQFRDYDDPIFEFNRTVINATSDLVCGYKLNLAFFEVHGSHGWETLQKTLQIIPRDLIRIADGKRNDIGNSAEKYAAALLDEMDFDAVTVNPYMGTDSVAPFLKNPEKGAFILALTSNPGAGDFQKLRVGDEYLYEKIIDKAQEWNTNRNVGIVVGATQATELASIRKRVPDMPILLPGVGAQGGDLERSIRYGCSAEKDLLLVTVGRSVIYAGSDTDTFKERVRTEAEMLRTSIEEYRHA